MSGIELHGESVGGERRTLHVRASGIDGRAVSLTVDSPEHMWSYGVHLDAEDAQTLRTALKALVGSEPRKARNEIHCSADSGDVLRVSPNDGEPEIEFIATSEQGDHFISLYVSVKHARQFARAILAECADADS